MSTRDLSQQEATRPILPDLCSVLNSFLVIVMHRLVIVIPFQRSNIDLVQNARAGGEPASTVRA